MEEGRSITLKAKAGGSEKVYWIIQRGDKESVVSSDRFSYTVDAGRVKGDEEWSLRFKAIYPSGVTRNENLARAATEEGFTEGRRFPHRQWFPETYKQTTWKQFVDTLVRPNRWQNALNFFLYRDMSQPIGSEDAFVYFNRDIPLRALE